MAKSRQPLVRRARRRPDMELPVLLDRTDPRPLHLQLADQWRAAIVDGRLSANTRLPSSRVLAQVLGVSRHIVLSAVDELIIEGYLMARQGSGVWVSPEACVAPDAETGVRPGRRHRWQLTPAPRSVSDPPPRPGAIEFRLGAPGLDRWSYDAWRRVWREIGRSRPRSRRRQEAAFVGTLLDVTVEGSWRLPFHTRHPRSPGLYCTRSIPMRRERQRSKRKYVSMSMHNTPDNARTVIGDIHLSLDGRVTGPQGEYDMGWIVPHAVTDAARAQLLEITTPATTVLLGRKNYQGFGSYWPPVADDTSADPRDRAFARWLNAVEKIVFSTTLTDAIWENARIVDADPATVIDDLRQQEGGDIIVLSSSSVIRSLLRADLLDRLSITLCPEVVGRGAYLFEDGLPSSSWTLRSSASTESGALCLVYDRRLETA